MVKKPQKIYFRYMPSPFRITQWNVTPFVRKIFCIILIFVLYYLIWFGLVNRHVESIEEPGYAAVDRDGRVMGPRVLPMGANPSGRPANGPLDPTVPYALPQKRPKPKRPRREPNEPAIGRRFFFFNTITWLSNLSACGIIISLKKKTT